MIPSRRADGAFPLAGRCQWVGDAGTTAPAWLPQWIVFGQRVVLVVLALAALSVQALDWHGREPPVAVGGDIDLVDHHGARFTLARVSGAPALLFFGFTQCGSTCPLALGAARQVLHDLGPDPHVSIVFVTLDPLNDGPEQMRQFVQRIDPRLIGLTGSPAQIERVAERYGVGVRRDRGAVEHSSMWYLLDQHARVRRVYAYDTPAFELADDLRRLRQPSGGGR